MPIRTTYTHARANLASLWDEVTQNREVVIIERQGAEPVAMIAADELAGLMETVHLLKSPRNAERLLMAVARAEKDDGTPQTVSELRRPVGPVAELHGSGATQVWQMPWSCVCSWNRRGVTCRW